MKKFWKVSIFYENGRSICFYVSFNEYTLEGIYEFAENEVELTDGVNYSVEITYKECQ